MKGGISELAVEEGGRARKLIKLHTEVFRDVCTAVRSVRTMELGRACGTRGEERNAYRVLVGKPQGKRPRGRLRGKWENYF
jgi:hypothetical protein